MTVLSFIAIIYHFLIVQENKVREVKGSWRVTSEIHDDSFPFLKNFLHLTTRKCHTDKQNKHNQQDISTQYRVEYSWVESWYLQKTCTENGHDELTPVIYSKIVQMCVRVQWAQAGDVKLKPLKSTREGVDSFLWDWQRGPLTAPSSAQSELDH